MIGKLRAIVRRASYTVKRLPDDRVRLTAGGTLDVTFVSVRQAVETGRAWLRECERSAGGLVIVPMPDGYEISFNDPRDARNIAAALVAAGGGRA